MVSKGGKSSGKNKFYINIVNENTNDLLGIHLDKVNYEVIDTNTTNLEKESFDTDNYPTQNEEVNVTSIPYSEHNSFKVRQAKEKELENWKSFDVYTGVPDIGQKTIYML